MIFAHRNYEEMVEYFDTAPSVLAKNEQGTLRLKERMFRHVVARLSRYFPAGKFPRRAIDFGCSYGHLSHQLQAAGWDVTGVDISRGMVEHHRQIGDFPAFTSLDDPEIPDGQASVIAMMDVLYYIEKPVELLALAHRKLATPGMVLLRVPNRNGYLRWASRLGGLVPVRLRRYLEGDHKTYWSAKAIRLAARQAGFDHVRIIRREVGYRYPPLQKVLHWTTQAISAATAGLVNLGMVFHAELWKGDPPQPR